MRPIDADALIEAMGEEPYVWTDSDDEIAERNQWLTDMHIIENAPTIEPKRGEWKRRIVDNGFNADWVCSECGYRVKTDFVDYNFCPNCGASMKGADNE